MLILVILFLFLSLIGFLTILERKIIGLIQNRFSIAKNSFFSLYHFYLDFLKILIKGFFIKNIKFNFYYFYIIILIGIEIFLVYLLILSFIFKSLFILIIFIFLLFEGIILILKIFIIINLKNNYVNLFIFKFKILYIFIEGFFSYILFLNLVILIYNNNFFLISNSFILFIFYIIIFYIAILIKVFRTPFDYFEIESELVGGGLLELKGLGYLLWTFFEYSFIFNNIFFIVCLINFYWNIKLFLVIFLLITLVNISFILRGFLLRIRFDSVIYLIIFFYFLLNFIIAISLLIC